VYEKTYAMDCVGFIREYCISDDEFMPNEAASSRMNSLPQIAPTEFAATMDITPHSMTEM
jgi:hypothetical protein